jgi:CHAT domain-containing protein
MKKKIFICVFLYFNFFHALLGQCPPKDSLQKEKMAARVNAIHSRPERLAVLLEYINHVMKCYPQGDSTYAWLLLSIGWEYADDRNFSEAANYFVQSIQVSQSFTKDLLTESKLINQYYWLSTFYDSLDNIAAKRRAIDSCIIISERLNETRNASFLRCILNRAQYFYDIGEYKFCINDAEIGEKEAREYLKIVKEPTDLMLGEWIVLNSFHWHINALLQLKKFSEASILLSTKAEEYKQKGPKSYLGLTYSQLADIDVQSGNYQQALTYFIHALKIYNENKNYFNCKQTLNNIGEKIYFKHFRDYNKALECFKKAMKFKDNSGQFIREDSIESLNIYGRIANVYIRKRMFDSAFFYFQKAFNQIRNGTTITNVLFSSPGEFIRYKKIEYLSDFLINYGDAYRKKYETTKDLGDLETCIDVYEKVDKFFARINISQFEQDSKLKWRQDSRRLYESAIEACYLLKNTEKAFYFFERSRATLLNIQLNEQNWLGRADVSKVDKIKQKITVLQNSITSLPEASKRKNKLKDSLMTANDEFYGLQQMIKEHYPLYYENIDTSVITIADVRSRLLKDRNVVIEMFSGDAFIYTLIITQDKVFVDRIDKNDFEETINSYTSYISNYELLNKSYVSFRKTAYHLYELIFKNKSLPDGRIIVSLDGYYFPFESLISDNNTPAPVYFISAHAISYTYSVRYLFNDFGSSHKIPGGNFFGLAPVRYSPGFQLAELSGSDVSLKKIQSSMNGSNILVSREASRSKFLQQFPGYEIIQLYTHASDSSDRKEPVIYFSDSALYVSEISSANRPATQLIVLSACETGSGRLYQGEGVFSFNRAFAALGIPSSVTNLWTINNKSTYAITELFYKNIAGGLPLDVALQKAKLEYMNTKKGDSQLPYYWAAAVLVGKSEPIPLKKSFQWTWLFVGISLAGGGYTVWRIVRSYKRKAIPVPDTTETAS